MTKTPAQDAKKYAAEHGFKIVANGRRYDVCDEHQNHIANVGGYPAALNAMRNHDNVQRVEAKQCKGINCTSDGTGPHSLECIAEHDRVTGAVEFGIPADTIVGEKPAYVPERRALTMEHYRNIEANTREHFANVNAIYGKFAVAMDVNPRDVQDMVALCAAPVKRPDVPRFIIEFGFGASPMRFMSPPYGSRDEALRAVRQMMADKRNRPSYVNIIQRGV